MQERCKGAERTVLIVRERKKRKKRGWKEDRRERKLNRKKPG